MKIATYTLRSHPETTHVGVLVGDSLVSLGERSMKGLLQRGPDALAKIAGNLAGLPGPRHALQDVRFLPPVPDPHKFLCVGKNYRSHLDELKRTNLIKEMPAEPTGFIKLNDCLTGHEAEVVRPATVTHLDYEPELVFVIGKPAYQVSEKDAFAHVAGITILNDLTCRDTQKREVASGSRFWTAKNAPGFGPLGPYIITMDEIRDPYDIWVTCSVNGEQRMRVNTCEQIWRLPRIIEHFSRLVPLMPGDMFSTGAPGGVAVGKPNAEDLFLKPGDVVECAFENPAMVLRNTIVAPEASPRPAG
jgi:2-keto-4-pentenoate hydratase/2-oxohepta-3-ene-1,7-dioic acid hydratase in catechol pathway